MSVASITLLKRGANGKKQSWLSSYNIFISDTGAIFILVFEEEVVNEMKKYLFLIAVFTLYLVAFQTNLLVLGADKEVLIVATNYPPYEVEHPLNDLRGFDVEVVKEAFRRAGIRATFEFYPWQRAIEMVREGKATAVLTCAKNPERENFMIMSDVISLMTDIFLVRKEYDGPPLSTIEDLQGTELDVGTVRGYAYLERLEYYGIPYDLSPSDEIALKKLADERIDVMPALLENSSYLIQKHGLTGRFKWFVMKEFLTNEFHVCFSKKWPGVEEMVSLFNQGLRSMKEDGTYESIHKKYQ